MKVGTMFSDVFRSLFQRPVTKQYPFVREDAPTRLRGHLKWNPEKCTGCGLCHKECPSNAVEVISIDKKAKRFVMRYNLDRCTFCAQCVTACRFDCIEMSSADWELASGSREPFTVFWGDDVDIEQVLGHLAPGAVEQAPETK